MTDCSRLRRDALRLFLLLSLTCLISASVGCDTVAEISIDQRTFNEIDSVGVIHGDSFTCGETDTEVSLNFMIADGDSVMIAPGEAISAGVVDTQGSDRNFDSEHINFSEQSFLYPSPDQTCTSDGDCSAPFVCAPINPFNPGGSRNACGLQIRLETFQGELQFDNGTSDTKTIAMVFDFSQTLEGVNPDGSFNASRSTDPQNRRISAGQTFLLKYDRGPFGDSTRICIVSFGGEGAAAVNFKPDAGDCLESSVDVLLSRMSVPELGVGETGASPVWSAIVETINQQLAGAPGDRHLILFTDGGDDGSLTDTFDSALNLALQEGVAIHVIHLDNNPEDIGPLPVAERDDFAQMACATGGSFQYARNPQDLRTLFSNLASNVAATYEARVQIGELVRGDVPSGAYRVATAMTVNVLGTSQTFNFAGDQSDPTSTDVVDTRLSVFSRPVPATSGNGGDGGNGSPE